MTKIDHYKMPYFRRSEAAAVYSPVAYLVVQDDANVVLYSATGKRLWDGLDAPATAACVSGDSVLGDAFSRT